MIGREIRHILTNDTDLSALVGGRVYADLRGQTNNTVPAIVYRVLDRRKEHSQDLAGLDIYRIEFAIYASTYREVQEIERRLDIALDRYPIGTVINTYIMDGVMQEDSQDDPYDINEDGLREKVCEYSVRVKRYVLVTNYTLSEADTGYTWVDGKAIYKRTIDLAAGADDYQDISIAIGYIDTLIKTEYISPTSSSLYNGPSQLRTDQGGANYEVFVAAADTDPYLTIWYTKA